MSAYRNARQAQIAPPRCEIALAELPPESQQRLLALARAEADPRKLRRDAHTTPIAAILVGAVIAAILALMTAEATSEITRKSEFDPGGYQSTFDLGLILAASFLVGFLFLGGLVVLA